MARGKNSRVTARDVAREGNLEQFIAKLIRDVDVGMMETKENAAAMLKSLTEQPRGLDGPQEKENAELIGNAGGVKPLVALMAAGSAIGQASACAALANIARGRPEYQKAIFDGGGVEPIAAALRLGDSHLQELASAALASVSQLEASRKAIIKVGAIPPLVALLKSASAETQVHVSTALAHLALGSVDSQGAIVRAGALPLLIAQLGSGKSQEAVAYALACLTQDHEANQAEVTRLGGIPKLVALLSVLNCDAQAKAAEALAALASGKARDEKDMISKAGGVRSLLSLVESRYSHTQRSAINALAMLSMDHKENQDSIVGLGGIPPLVALTVTAAAPADVQAQAVLAIAEISRQNFEHQTTIASTSAITQLVDLLRHSKVGNCHVPKPASMTELSATLTVCSRADVVFPCAQSLMVECEVSGAVWALSENHAANKIQIAAAEAIRELVAQLKATVERGSQEIVDRAHVNAAHAVASISFDNETNQAEATALLVALLEEGSVSTQQRAAELLWRMVAENPESSYVLASSGDLEQLVRLLHSTLPRAKAYALWSLSLSIDQGNQKTVVNTGAIQPLVSLLSSTDCMVTEQASCALHLLAKNDPETQLAVATENAIPPLIKLLKGDDVSRSQEYAAAALAALANVPANKKAIDVAGGIGPLVDLLCDDIGGEASPQTKRYAASALARLSADNNEGAKQMQKRDGAESTGETVPVEEKDPGEDNKEAQAKPLAAGTRSHAAEKIAAAGAIGPLVGLLSGELGAESQEEAAGALWALAALSKNRHSISEHKGIGPLVELLGSQNPRARGHAERALVRLSIEVVNRVQIIKQLVSLLHENSGDEAQEQAAGALATMARESNENRNSIRESGGIPKLLALLKSESPKTKENSVAAIAELAFKNAANQKSISENGGVPHLVSIIVSASANVKELNAATLCTLTASAIWNLSDGNSINQNLLAKEGAIVPTISLLHTTSTAMQSNAAGALGSLARGHYDNQEAIAKSGALAPLCTMLRDGSPETRDESAGMLI